MREFYIHFDSQNVWLTLVSHPLSIMGNRKSFLERGVGGISSDVKVPEEFITEGKLGRSLV